MSLSDGSIQQFPLTLNRILDHAAKWHPDVEVVTATGRSAKGRVGYSELRQRALHVSSVLAELGVVQGERVATLAWNTQAHVESWFAIMGMGAVCHTLNPRLTAAQLAWMVDKSGARILIVSGDLYPLAKEVAAHAPGIASILAIDDDGAPDIGEAVRLEILLGSAGPSGEWASFDENAPCGLCFTSGSTGDPKGVTYTHRSSFLHTLRLLQADVLGARSVDTIMPVVPMFHANAWGLPFAVPAAGAKLVLPGRHLDGASLARLIADEEVTTAVGVPTVWLGLCDYLEASGTQVPSLQRIVSGGAALPPALQQRFEERFGIRVQTSWGMTELSPVGVFGVLSDAHSDASISGRPALGIDLMVADETGVPLAQQREREGRLHVRGAAVIERYFGSDATVVDEDGWFDTGDLAVIDRTGNLRITGRAKDLIKSGGEWINPAEIEEIVNALPEVALSAVIGRSDPKWGERPVLLVEMRTGRELTDEQLLGGLKGRLAAWWIPDQVVRLHSLPLAATGKINKIALREAYSHARPPSA